MAMTRFPLILRQAGLAPLRGSLLSLGEVTRLAGVHPALAQRLMALGLLDPVETTPEPLFDVAAVLRLRRILRLRQDLGVNWVGIGLVLDLLGKVDELEQEIKRLRQSRG
jgi:MerR family transcriptional regulator, heat shock protein HspR